MKKLVQHGKFWLLGVVISLCSFAFLQIDSDRLTKLETQQELAARELDEEETDEMNVVQWDVIKKMSVFLLEIIQHTR